MKPEAKIIVRAPSGIPVKLLLFAAAGGLALVLWNWNRAESARPSPHVTASAAPVSIQPNAPPSSAVLPRVNGSAAISTEALRGPGITMAGWLKRLVDGSPERVRCSPENLIAMLPPLTMSDYDGDASLPLGEALDLLRFAGLAVTAAEAPNTLDVRWADSRTRIAADVFAANDPDGLTWGALRSWQKLTIKLEATGRQTLSEVKDAATPVQLRTIAWAVGGDVCSLDNGADGHIVCNRSRSPTPDERDAFLKVLAASAEKSELINDAVAGLAELVQTESATTASPRTERAVAILTRGLNARELETRRLSAWALGRTPSVQAIVALVETIENSACPEPLASAALAALAYSERANRQTSAVEMGENAGRRHAAYTRLRSWLSESVAKPDPANAEFAAAFIAVSAAFQIDATLLHMKLLQVPRNPTERAVAGPGWLHVPFDAGDALTMLRSGERRNVRAALWRWNRLGADVPTQAASADTEGLLLDAMKALATDSPSATQRRLALDALFRPSDARLGSEPHALCDETIVAQNLFLNDPSPGVQRSASVIVGRLGGIVQLQALLQAELPARAPAGTDVLLQSFVQRYWINTTETEEETSFALGALTDQLLTSESAAVAERAAWAKMQNPALDATEKLRVAKAMPRPSLRAAALMSINVSRAPVEIPTKFVDVFLDDQAAAVREAVFRAHLPQWVKRGAERTKLYARGMQDSDASVRLAILKSRLSVASETRDALHERVASLAESDASSDVRAAAAAWLSSGAPVREKE